MRLHVGYTAFGMAPSELRNSELSPLKQPTLGVEEVRVAAEPAQQARRLARPPETERMTASAAACEVATWGPGGPHRGVSARRRLVDRQRLLDRFFRDLDLHARALFLQEHRDARVALGPAAVERLGHLLERDVGQLHRHLVLAPERRRQRDVLVGQSQRERWRIELPGQELIGETVERAAATTRPLP